MTNPAVCLLLVPGSDLPTWSRKQSLDFAGVVLLAQFRDLSYVHASMQPFLITLSGVWPVPTTSDVRRREKSPVADLRMKI